MKLRVFLLSLFIFLTINFGAVYAADEGLNLVLSPLPINLVTTAGSTVSAQLKIKNGGIEPEDLEIGLMKFSAYGDEGKPRLMDREKADDYFDWMTFSEKDFTLNPNEWKTITATINVPANAAFGYYYAVTFQRKSDDRPGKTKSNKVVGATATLILLEVRVPNAIRSIDVLEFSTPQGVYEFLPTKFMITLKNKGNVHVIPKGNIFIDGWWQKDVAILNVNELSGNVLPDSNRIFDAEWTDGFPVYQQQLGANNTIITDRQGKALKKLKWDFSQVPKMRWGKYTANLLLVYDDGKRDVPIEGTLSFWVIPWRIIGGGTLVLLLILRGLWASFRGPIKKLVEKLRKK